MRNRDWARKAEPDGLYAVACAILDLSEGKE